MEKYTREQLSEILKEKAKEIGKIPRIKDMKNPNGSIFITYFGTWNEALLYSGLKPINERKIYNKENLINVIQQTAQKINRTPTIDDIKNPSRIVFKYHFGSWNNALKEAGFQPLQIRKNKSEIFKKFTKEQLLTLLIGWTIQHHNTLKYLNIQQSDDMPSPAFIIRKLNCTNWNEVTSLVQENIKSSLKTNVKEQIILYQPLNKIVKEIPKIIDKTVNKTQTVRKNTYFISKETEEYLKDNYSNTQNKVLANDLDIPLNEIVKIAGKLKLKKSKTFLSELAKTQMKEKGFL